MGLLNISIYKRKKFSLLRKVLSDAVFFLFRYEFIFKLLRLFQEEETFRGFRFEITVGILNIIFPLTKIIFPLSNKEGKTILLIPL